MRISVVNLASLWLISTFASASAAAAVSTLSDLTVSLDREAMVATGGGGEQVEPGVDNNNNSRDSDDMEESSSLSLSLTSHYGAPPECESDELALSIQGIPGQVCAPQCTDFQPCPTDVPDGVTATPMCALKDASTNTQYCVLLCQAGGDKKKNNKNNLGDDQCGEATCQEVKGQGGIGVCTYGGDNSSDDKDNKNKINDVLSMLQQA